MKIKWLYIILSFLAVGLLLGATSFIYIDGQRSIHGEIKNSEKQFDDSLLFLDFISRHKSFIHHEFKDQGTLIQAYEYYIANLSTLEVFKSQSLNEHLELLKNKTRELKKLQINKIEKGPINTQVTAQLAHKWAELEKTFGDEIILRMDKGQEFMPGFKKTLSLWAKDVPLFEKLKEKIDVSYVTKDKFNELQDLIFLSQKVISLNDGRADKKDTLQKEADEFLKVMDQTHIPSKLKSQFRDHIDAYLLAHKKMRSLKDTHVKLNSEIEKLREQIDQIVSDDMMPAWHSYMTGHSDQQLAERNARHRLLIELVALIGVVLIIILLIIFLNIFPYLNKLEVKAREISEGIFDRNFEKIPSNEIGQVMLAFNEMSRQLEHYLEKLKLEEKNKIQLTESLQRIRRMSELGEFSSKMAHEIKNPISILTFCLADAKESLNEADYQKCGAELTKSLQALERLKHISQRLGSKAQNPSFEVIEMKNLLNELLEMYSSWVGNENIEIDLKMLEEGVFVFAPKLELQSAISNLVDNAIEYLRDQKNKAKEKIWIELSSKEKTIELIISNQGQMIEEADKIFHNFYSTKDGAQRGLGLSIVKDIVEMSQGRLEYQFLEGKNLFKIILPRHVD